MFSDHILAPIDPLYNFDFEIASVWALIYIFKRLNILVFDYITIVLSLLVAAQWYTACHVTAGCISELDPMRILVAMVKVQ